MPCAAPMADKLLERFYRDLQAAGLLYDRDFVGRFLAALLARRFVLLTGLSGSGKTQLALALAQWMSKQVPPGVSYSIARSETGDDNRILDSDRLGVLVEQKKEPKKVLLPYELIKEFRDVLRKNPDVTQTQISEEVGKTSTFSPQLISFRSVLTNLAARLVTESLPATAADSRMLLIPVGADWTNREPLLGFPNTLEPGKYIKPDHALLDLLLVASQEANRHVPFFLILDEMNLSHVERYFADFLSAMEAPDDIMISLHSSETPMRAQDGTEIPAKIPFPRNVFIVGTVNIDETTYMFSPKVLDRANVLEFRVHKDAMKAFLGTMPARKKIEPNGAQYASAFLDEALSPSRGLDEAAHSLVLGVLTACFEHLEPIGAEFGFRTAHEILRYVEKYANLLLPDEALASKIGHILDSAIAQKLLPKLHGSRRKLEPVLAALAGLCLKAPPSAFSFDTRPLPEARFPISLEKICRMQERAVSNGFASFAEA